MAQTIFPPASLGSSGTDPSAGAGGIALGSLTDECQIVSNLGLDDSIGGKFDDWQVVREYPCLIVPMAPKMETTEGAQVTSVGVFEIYLPIDAELTAADRIRSGGVDYEVRERPPALATQTLLKVIAEWVE